MCEEDTPLRNDPRATEDIIAEAIRLGEDEDEYWQIVYILHQRATRDVFENALNLCQSKSAAGRILGCNIIARLGEPDHPFLSESVPVLIDILGHEEDADVIAAAIAAVSWLKPKDERVMHLLAELRHHPDPWVRGHLAQCLPAWNDQMAIDTLIELTNDKHDGVRDWATFGLGSIVEDDTPKIREALWRRTEDTDPIVRGEALKGLALRKDARVIEPIIKDLQTISEATVHAMEAASYIADSRLCPALTALRGNPDVPSEDIDEALTACRCKRE